MADICGVCPARQEKGVGDTLAGELIPLAAPFYLARRIGSNSPDELDNMDDFINSVVSQYELDYEDYAYGSRQMPEFGAKLGGLCIQKFLENKCLLDEAEYAQANHRY